MHKVIKVVLKFSIATLISITNSHSKANLFPKISLIKHGLIIYIKCTNNSDWPYRLFFKYALLELLISNLLLDVWKLFRLRSQAKNLPGDLSCSNYRFGWIPLSLRALQKPKVPGPARKWLLLTWWGHRKPLKQGARLIVPRGFYWLHKVNLSSLKLGISDFMHILKYTIPVKALVT